jgi:hypothetical protein
MISIERRELWQRIILTAQSPSGMGMSWAMAAPAKVAARMAKDFILTVGGGERLGRRGY